MKLKITVVQTGWKWSVKECLLSVRWPFRWDCSMDSCVHWNLKCYTTQDDWAEYCNIHVHSSDLHVEYPVRYLGNGVCIFFLSIIVQNLCTERGDPSASSVCSLQTTGHMQGKLDWSRAMSLWPSPSWWNSGWLQWLLIWLHSLWLPSPSMSPMEPTERCEMELRDCYCLAIALVLWSHVILVSWQLYQPSRGQAVW